MLGINSENIFLGYSYDISNSELSSFHNGTHAISLGIYFNGNNQNKYVRKRNRFSEIRQNKPGVGSIGTENQNGGKQYKFFI